MIYMEKFELLLDLLKNDLSGYGFAGRGRTFKRSFEGGCWLFNVNSRSSVKYGGDFITYTLFFHIDSLEKTVSIISGEKCKKDSFTGGWGQIGSMFSHSSYFEHFIDSTANMDDIRFDVMYHFERYVLPAVRKYANAKDILNELAEGGRLKHTLSCNAFKDAAVQILKGDRETAERIIANAPQAYFCNISKEACIENIHSIDLNDV